MEVEDDVFLADLNKQISLLIMDDDEDQVTHCPSVSLQAFTRANHAAPSPQSSSLSTQQICRRESKGTGVFIPQSSSHMRRKNKQGRFFRNSSNTTTKFPRHSNDNSRGPPPHASSMNNPSHNSFNPSKRC
ncbi:unnamed protein product [Camellia sinensis]